MLMHNQQPLTLSQVVILDSSLYPFALCLSFWQRCRYSFRWQGGEVNAYPEGCRPTYTSQKSTKGKRGRPPKPKVETS